MSMEAWQTSNRGRRHSELYELPSAASLRRWEHCDECRTLHRGLEQLRNSLEQC
jgi:hypothetical protein